MTPPAIAPTFGPDPDIFEELELIVDPAADEATQTVFWHASQVGGTSEQISPSGHVGQAGVVSLGHPVTQRRKREYLGTTVNQLANDQPSPEDITNVSRRNP
jgi:hypothetical protein